MDTEINAIPDVDIDTEAVAAATGLRSTTIMWIILGIAGLIILGLLGLIAWLAYSKNHQAKPGPSIPSLPSKDKCLSSSKTYSNTDFESLGTVGTLENATQKQCQDTCLAYNQCQAWSYDSGSKKCNLVAAPKSDSLTGINTGVSGCSQWTVYPSADYGSIGTAVGTPSTGISQSACAQLCSSTSPCNLYVYNPTSPSTCSMYQISAPSSGYVTGVRVQPQ